MIKKCIRTLFSAVIALVTMVSLGQVAYCAEMPLLNDTVKVDMMANECKESYSQVDIPIKVYNNTGRKIHISTLDLSFKTLDGTITEGLVGVFTDAINSGETQEGTLTLYFDDESKAKVDNVATIYGAFDVYDADTYEDLGVTTNFNMVLSDSSSIPSEPISGSQTTTATDVEQAPAATDVQQEPVQQAPATDVQQAPVQQAPVTEVQQAPAVEQYDASNTTDMLQQSENGGSFNVVTSGTENLTDEQKGQLAGLAGVGIAIIIIVILVSLVVVLISLIAFWKLFAKAGYKGWKSLIPGYNIYILFEIVYASGVKFLFLLIPFYNMYILIKFYFDLAKVFGKSTGFAFCTVFFGSVTIPIMAFGSSEYQGPIC